MSKPKFARPARGGRVYDLEGETYPSVTTVIKQLAAPALERWKMNRVAEAAYDTSDWRDMPRESATKMILAAGTAFGERAADVGSAIHELIETGTPSTDPAFMPRLTAAAEVLAGMGTHYATELTLCNPKVGYAGTADVMSQRIDQPSELRVTDWKTVQPGKNVGWVNHGLQVAALAGCTHYVEHDGSLVEVEYPITEISVVGLRPNGSHDEKRTSNELLIRRLQVAFEGLLRSWELERDWRLDSW